MLIEKSMVQYNAFMGTVSTEGAVTTSIKLVDAPRSQPSADASEVWTGND